LSSLKEVSSISIIDVLGRQVYSNANISPGTIEMNQNLATGMYVVNVRSGSFETNIKMIVE
ncbi:MAG: T9SS type A sorting domain-containing protein, partial [Aequorivita sp.]|nr:T9SS type A sorting domain-containing protein [Aequorivita sp.]